MTSEPSRTRSQADVRAILARFGADPKLVDDVLSNYPDPIDMAEAEPALMAKLGITRGGLEDRMGGSP